MKRILIAAILLLPISVAADLVAPISKESAQVSLEDMPTVFDEYMAQQGQIVTIREYELPEFKSTCGSGLTKSTYKATTAIVSFTVGDKTAFYLRITRKPINYSEITRYISFEDLVDLRGALDSLEANLSTNPLGGAVGLQANYSIKGKFYDLGYEIVTVEKKGELVPMIKWYFNMENRDKYNSYCLYSDSPEYFKEYLSDVIARIRKLM